MRFDEQKYDHTQPLVTTTWKLAVIGQFKISVRAWGVLLYLIVVIYFFLCPVETFWANFTKLWEF